MSERNGPVTEAQTSDLVGPEGAAPTDGPGANGKPGTEGDSLAQKLGIEILEASPDRVVGTMPVRGNTQPYGLLHGGASCALAETIGSIGAALHGATTGGALALGIEINATHHKAARSGRVTGVANAVHRGRSVATYEVLITDEAGNRVCTARLTCLLRHP